MTKRKRLKLPRIRSLGGSWSFEATTPRMKKPCTRCRHNVDTPLRVKFVQDAYPYPETMIFCLDCARRAVWRAVKVIKINVREFCQHLPPRLEK